MMIIHLDISRIQNNTKAKSNDCGSVLVNYLIFMIFLSTTLFANLKLAMDPLLQWFSEVSFESNRCNRMVEKEGMKV